MNGDLRAAVLDRLQELVGLAAEPDEEGWYDEPFLAGVLGYDPDGGPMHPGDPAFIAAHSPSVMRPVWEALAAEVERWHRYAEVSPSRAGCPGCAETFGEAGACGFVTRLAAALGVSPDSPRRLRLRPGHGSGALANLSRTSGMEWRCECGEVFPEDAAWLNHARVAGAASPVSPEEERRG